ADADLAMTALAQGSERSAVARRLCEQRRGARSAHRDTSLLRVLELDVVGDDETPERFPNPLAELARDVEPELALDDQHAEIGDHLALLGEEKRVSPLAGAQARDVVAEHALEKAGAVLAPCANDRAVFERRHRGSPLERFEAARRFLVENELPGRGSAG